MLVFIKMNISESISMSLCLQLMTMLHFIWIGPLEIIVVLAILWAEIGPPAIAGFVVMFAMFPLIQFFGHLTEKYK